MTYCIGIKLKSGLLGISDTMLTSGYNIAHGKKMYTFKRNKHSVFIMTSGLRSVTDKVMTYFAEIFDEKVDSFDKTYKMVNELAAQFRRVALEDKVALASSGYVFDINAIIGGQSENDEDHKLYQLYPQGNWVEVGEGTPFVIIGNSGYGKPILNRTLKFNSEISHALKLAFLSFDSTRKSSTDVDYPIDVVVYHKDTYQFQKHRFEESDLIEVSQMWGKLLSDAVSTIPDKWMAPVLGTNI